jgi:integrase/recombinase XerD
MLRVRVFLQMHLRAAMRQTTACERTGLQGVSTPSLWRRSALTSASDKGVPLRHIQSLSGHASLDCLSKYLQVTDGQKRTAALAFA